MLNRENVIPALAGKAIGSLFSAMAERVKNHRGETERLAKNLKKELQENKAQCKKKEDALLYAIGGGNKHQLQQFRKTAPVHTRHAAYDNALNYGIDKLYPKYGSAPKLLNEIYEMLRREDEVMEQLCNDFNPERPCLWDDEDRAERLFEELVFGTDGEGLFDRIKNRIKSFLSSS